MSVVDKEIIAATTQAATSEKFSTLGTSTLMSDALVGSEKVTLQQTRDGSTWLDVVLNGVTQTLDRKHTQLTLSGPGQFRIKKSVTASAVGVSRWWTEGQ